jgi:hypothetical protein
MIVFDIDRRVLAAELSDEEIPRRLAPWQLPAPRFTGGVFAKYVALVGSASEGAIIHPWMRSVITVEHNERGHPMNRPAVRSIGQPAWMPAGALRLVPAARARGS